MAKKKNWELIQERGVEDTLTHRNVYEQQQLERGTRGESQSMAKWGAAAIAAAVGAFLAMWLALSIVPMFIDWSSDGGAIVGIESVGGKDQSEATYYDEDTTIDPMEGMHTVFYELDEAGNRVSGPYDEFSKVPVPEWWQGRMAELQAEADGGASCEAGAGSGEAIDYFGPTWWKVLASLAVGLLLGAVLWQIFDRMRRAQNLMTETQDINQYENDQHIALPEEVMRKFDYFPDAGAHSSVQVSSMISHVMLQNKGLKKVGLARRAEKDVYDEDGDLELYAGEMLLDEDGESICDKVPFIDEQFGEDLFEASGLPKGDMRVRYDTTKVPYNPGNENRDKLKGYDTVADLINGDWEFPPYEPQRPAGAYLVDTAPVNTMVLAITRAGKGQTVIEPTLDMWSREKEQQNMIVNDPKGELLVKNYVPFAVRGYQNVQFNLINALKTDIYNPLAMAAQAAREGDVTKCAMYVENIAEIFFPLDGGEDPVWPNAANNAFKRASYGLIDYYLEEERELRAYAESVNMDPGVMETQIDQLWGKVTLYNCYQLFVQLSAKKLRNPRVTFNEWNKTNEAQECPREVWEAKKKEAEDKSVLWMDAPEVDLLSLFFNATNQLPNNQIRTLVRNADNALRAMGSAEKMLASVYGIAITAMSFFTDPTISTLTSGTLSQNVDLAGLSFPRRFGVRFHSDFCTRDHLVGMSAHWSAYADERFEQELGKEFYHEDMVSREGWARYYFKGIFPGETAYLKLELVNPQTGMHLKSFHFKFDKGYQMSLDGRYYVTDPVLEEKIVKDGTLVELTKGPDGRYVPGKLTFPSQELVDIDIPTVEKVMRPCIRSMLVRYAEKPKAVFLVTPPHLMKYAKLLLILIKQLVDLNFDQSYMTKSNQKPLYRSRFMLDELGNLQSEGHGISGFETMLSIGLGQEQQFTLILQTLQQLKAVYGDDVDKIVQGNVSNIVFLKSTDDDMIETLEKMSGKTHRSYTNQKQVTRDIEKIWLRNEGMVTYTMSTEEAPVISYNDMAFISERNSIVFRAGDAPIWNRRQTILPMSWRLFQNKIVQPGKVYSLQTIPTLSSAIDFDVRKNQPDFQKMLDKRIAQAMAAPLAAEVYQEGFGYSEYEIEQLDPDTYAEDVMGVVDAIVHADDMEVSEEELAAFEAEAALAVGNQYDRSTVVKDEEVIAETRAEMARKKQREEMRFAGGLLSYSNLIGDGGAVNHQLDQDIVAAFIEVKGDFEQDRDNFVMKNGNLYALDGIHPYITQKDESDSLAAINAAAKDPGSKVYAEEDVKEIGTHVVHDEFIRFLSQRERWDFANGRFEREMHRRLAEG